jgi:hypothetical protein
MSTTPQYDHLLAELAGGELSALERQVFDLLKANPDGLTRYQLLAEIYGPKCAFTAKTRGLANSSEDRKIRKAVEALRERGICIVSSSGEAGYRLDTSPEAVSAMVNEWQSRVNRLNLHIKRVVVIYDLPHPSNPKQLSFFRRQP